MEGAMEDLQDMFIVHTIEEVQVGIRILPSMLRYNYISCMSHYYSAQQLHSEVVFNVIVQYEMWIDTYNSKENHIMLSVVAKFKF